MFCGKTNSLTEAKLYPQSKINSLKKAENLTYTNVLFSLLSYALLHGPTDRTVVFYCYSQHISKGAVFRVNVLQLALHKFPYSSESEG